MRFSIVSVALLGLLMFFGANAFADGTTVAYYDLNGNALADVGLIDGVAGSNVNFMNVGGRDAAVFGTGIDDGSFDHIIAFASPHVATSTFSISLWFNVTDTGGQPQGIFDLSGDSGASGNGVQMLFGNQAQPSLIARLDGAGASSSVINAGSGFDNGMWRSAALTYDGSIFSFYVDNTLIDTGAVTGPVAFDSDQYLGAFNLNGNNANKGLAGALDDFAIYDGVLSSQQIADLASGAANPSDFAPIPEPACFAVLLPLSTYVARRRRR